MEFIRSFLPSSWTSGTGGDLETILAGDIEPMVDAVQRTLFVCDAVQFHPKNGFTEASFVALFIHHLQLLIRAAGRASSVKLKAELYLKVQPTGGKFVDLWIHDEPGSRAVLLEFKYARLGYLLLPHDGGRLLTGAYDDRRNLRAACTRLRDPDVLHSDNLRYKDFDGTVKLLRDFRLEALAQARGYAALLDKNGHRPRRLTLAAVVGYGNRITFETVVQ